MIHWAVRFLCVLAVASGCEWAYSLIDGEYSFKSALLFSIAFTGGGVGERWSRS